MTADCISIQIGCITRCKLWAQAWNKHRSLGKDGTTACVSNITVMDINLHNTMTWQGVSGSVHGVLFSNFQVFEVEFPILIDQYYSNHNNCANHASAVALSNIAYETLYGCKVY